MSWLLSDDEIKDCMKEHNIKQFDGEEYKPFGLTHAYLRAQTKKIAGKLAGYPWKKREGTTIIEIPDEDFTDFLEEASSEQ